MMMFNIGDEVKITNKYPVKSHHGLIGTVVEIFKDEIYPYRVKVPLHLVNHLSVDEEDDTAYTQDGDYFMAADELELSFAELPYDPLQQMDEPDDV